MSEPSSEKAGRPATEIQRPLAIGPHGCRLAPLLADADGRPIKTLAAWEVHREQIRRTWLEMLGPFAEAPCGAPAIEPLVEDRVGPVTRQLVRYRGERGPSAEAYLLMPAASCWPAPGVVVFHSTVDESIEEPAGVGEASPKALGLTLAEQGFVAFCPRNFLWRGTRLLAMRRQTLKFRCRHPRSKGMAKMLHDAVLAVNVLEGLPQVDPARIGAVGHSLGAKQALYLAAFDRRVRVAAANEGGIGIRFSNWDAPWYLGRQVRRPDFRHDHHELLALIAPRAFLLLGGDGYDGVRSQPFIEAALPVYRLYGSPGRLRLHNHGRGHSFPPEAAARISQWLQTYA